MRAKWKSRDICNDLPYLIIEAGPSLKEIYFETKHLLQMTGILIIGVDGPTLLSQKEMKGISEELTEYKISFQIIGSFIWVESSQGSNLFEKTSFGASGDTCFFFKEKPDKFTLRKIPRLKGVWRKRFPDDLIRIFKKYESNVIYITNDIPDLLIVAKDERYLDYIEELIS